MDLFRNYYLVLVCCFLFSRRKNLTLFLTNSVCFRLLLLSVSCGSVEVIVAVSSIQYVYFKHFKLSTGKFADRQLPVSMVWKDIRV